MTSPTFQELLTSQEARFTNEQLEAWASLGPWEWGETGSRFQPETALVHKDAGIVLNASWRPSSCEVTVSDPDSEALIAAAPALAAALLAERKAREVEVGELKAAALDLISQCHASIRITGIHYTPVISTRFNRSVELLLETINKDRQALKGPTP